MVSLRLREQQDILTYLSLGISAWALWLRFFTLPHSLKYAILNVMFVRYSLDSRLIMDGVIIQIIFGFVIGLIVYCLFHGLRSFKHFNYKAFFPLAINLFTVIVFLFMQYVVVLPAFYANLKEREAVVVQITSGQLTLKESQSIVGPMFPNDYYSYKIYKLTLPSKYTHLSKGREGDGEINILVDKSTSQLETVVFFNSFGGFDKNDLGYTAFVYKAKTNSISGTDLLGVGNLHGSLWLLESKQIKDDWFWVDSIDD